ncbi:hypothetical protein PWT90_02250 [Aphanocladium album]|nr:hypothetical protein PWT90_02250 [Aphanocladium album]
MQRVSIQPMRTALRSSAMRSRLAGTRQAAALLHSQRALMSTSARRLADTGKSSAASTTTTAPASQAKQTASGESQNGGNPELPTFSLDGLGVSKNMKIFLIVVLSIFGTMETWFYCKAIYRWWYGEQGLAVTEDNK